MVKGKYNARWRKADIGMFKKIFLLKQLVICNAVGIPDAGCIV